MNLNDIIRRPLMTEKSNIGTEIQNLYTFAVDPRATKQEIRQAVQMLMGVTVVDVHTMNMPRKTRRVGKHVGRKPAWKKAIVRLAEGQSIEIFEGV